MLWSLPRRITSIKMFTYTLHYISRQTTRWLTLADKTALAHQTQENLKNKQQKIFKCCLYSTSQCYRATRYRGGLYAEVRMINTDSFLDTTNCVCDHTTLTNSNQEVEDTGLSAGIRSALLDQLFSSSFYSAVFLLWWVRVFFFFFICKQFMLVEVVPVLISVGVVVVV